MCQKCELQIACLDSCPLEHKCGMNATNSRKIMHSMICVTNVYSRAMINASVWACQKLYHLDLLRHHKCDKCQTLS